jgi:hypothetical protein
MKSLRLLILIALVPLLLLAACASVDTRVVPLGPAQQFAPTKAVEVLLQKPQRPHVEIALIESKGFSEAELLEDARERAKALGADAIVKQETERLFHPPVAVYDPWYDPFYFGYHRFRPYPYYGSPWGPFRYTGGTYSYVLKAVAIKYTG